MHSLVTQFLLYVNFNPSLTLVHEKGCQGNKKKLTAECNSRGGNNTSLDDSVLLASEGLLEKTTLAEKHSVGFDHCKTQQPCCNVEGWYDSCGEVEFAHNEDEHHTQDKACHHWPQCDLVWRCWHTCISECLFTFQVFLFHVSPSINFHTLNFTCDSSSLACVCVYISKWRYNFSPTLEVWQLGLPWDFPQFTRVMVL